jgi:hypothetical protein
MKHFFDTVANQSNVLVSNASVTVYLAGTTTKAPLFSDDGLTSLANPVFTGQNGIFSFYVADGKYDFLITGPNISTLTVHAVEIVDVTEANPGEGDAPWQTDNFEVAELTLANIPGTPPTGYMSVYSKLSPKHLFVKDDTGVETDLFTAVGSGAQPPLNSLQYDNLGSLAGSQFIYNSADTSGQVCLNTCADVTTQGDSAIGLTAADGINFVSMVAESGTSGGASLGVGTTSSSKEVVYAANTYCAVGGNSGNSEIFPGSTGSAAIANESYYSDIAGDPVTGQDIVGFVAQPGFQRATGVNLHWAVGYLLRSPINDSGSSGVPATGNLKNSYGLVVSDQLGLSTVDTAGILIYPQTQPSSGTLWAIEAQTGAGVSLFADGITGNPTSTIGTLGVPVGNIAPGTSGQCINTSGVVATWGSCAGTAGVQLLSVNSTPVTQNAAVTTPQILQASAFPVSAGALNNLNKTLRVKSYGAFQPANAIETVTFYFSFGGITGNFGGFTPNSGGSSYGFSIELMFTTTVTGSSGTVLVTGNMDIGGLSVGLNSATIVIPGVGTFSPIDLTSALSPAISVAFTSASTSNVATGDLFYVEQLN